MLRNHLNPNAKHPVGFSRPPQIVHASQTVRGIYTSIVADPPRGRNTTSTATTTKLLIFGSNGLLELRTPSSTIVFTAHQSSSEDTVTNAILAGDDDDFVISASIGQQHQQNRKQGPTLVVSSAKSGRELLDNSRLILNDDLSDKVDSMALSPNRVFLAVQTSQGRLYLLSCPKLDPATGANLKQQLAVIDEILVESLRMSGASPSSSQVQFSNAGDALLLFGGQTITIQGNDNTNEKKRKMLETAIDNSNNSSTGNDALGDTWRLDYSTTTRSVASIKRPPPSFVFAQAISPSDRLIACVTANDRSAGSATICICGAFDGTLLNSFECWSEVPCGAAQLSLCFLDEDLLGVLELQRVMIGTYYRQMGTIGVISIYSVALGRAVSDRIELKESESTWHVPTDRRRLFVLSAHNVSYYSPSARSISVYTVERNS